MLNVKQSLARVKNDEGGPKKTKLIFQEPKTVNSIRTVPIPGDILIELKSHKAKQNQEKLFLGEAYSENGLVFCLEDGNPIDPRNFTRHFEKLLVNAGLPKKRFHDVRHTFATIMLSIGEHPKVVQEILGHNKITTTLDIYSHVFPELKQKAAEKMNDVLKERKTLP